MAEGLTAWRQHCVTCGLWDGSRKASHFRIRAEYRDNNVKGVCTGGEWKGEETAALQTCAKWAKWSVLK